MLTTTENYVCISLKNQEVHAGFGYNRMPKLYECIPL